MRDFPIFDRWPLDSFGFLLDNGGTLLWHWTCYFGGFLLLICCCLHGLYFGYLQETWASLREDSHTAVSVPLSIKVCTDLLMKFIDEGPHSHFLVLDNNGIIWWLNSLIVYVSILKSNHVEKAIAQWLSEWTLFKKRGPIQLQDCCQEGPLYLFLYFSVDH